MRVAEDSRGNRRIVDDDGETVATKIKGRWEDPYGGAFNGFEVDEFDDMVVRHEASELGEGFSKHMGDILVEERQRTRRFGRPVERESAGQRRAAAIAEQPASRTKFR